MKFYFLLAGSIFFSATAGAQGFEDAIRLGQLTGQSTARATAIGGAVGAVGADFGALSVNPAGIGLYNRGEFTFSTSFRANNVEATYFPKGQNSAAGSPTSEDRGAFSISNIGYVGVNRTGTRSDFERKQSGGWQSSGFAIGLNRVADFNRSYTYSGRNSTSSVSQVFVNDANSRKDGNGLLPANTDGLLAYNAFLTDYDSTLNSYLTNADISQGALNQRQIVQERGGLTEALIGFGGNYAGKLMVGGTLGFPFLRYVRTSTFSEADADNNMQYFDRFEYYQNLRTTGVGINLKIGAIYRPVQGFRVGLALHTPTYMSVQETYDVSLFNQRTGYAPLVDSPIRVNSDPNNFSYDIVTPWRTVLSAMAVIGEQGFISADYEYVGYSNTRFIYETRENQAAFGPGYYANEERRVNDEIRGVANNASNIRLGGEYRIGGGRDRNNIYLRAGFGLYGSPYKSGFLSSSRKDYTGGIGLRGAIRNTSRAYILELALVQSQFETGEYAYIAAYSNSIAEPEAKLKNSLTNLTLTFGLRF